MEMDKLFNLLGNAKLLQSLIKAENQIETDDDSLEFENENGRIKLNITDNGIQINYSYEENEDTELRDQFISLCDTLDDDIFDEICETYTKVYGEGSLNDLNKNLTKDGIYQFLNIARDIIIDKCSMYNNYKDNINQFIYGL